jgi:hypothetical protein
MNSYELSRKWFNFCFDNPEKIKPTHSAIYFFAIEHCNRLGWKEKFGFPSQMVMEAIGVKNWRTYSQALNELVEFGFIKMIEISKNQYSSNIIAIVKNTKAPTKALDKALQKHTTKQGQSIVSIDKQETINNKQGNHLFKNSPYYNKNFYLKEISKTDFNLDNIDFGAYWYSMDDYSEQNSKMYKNWLATARSWIRRDVKDGKVKTKQSKGKDYLEW